MKVAYITAQAPWGRGETFIIEEMLAVKKLGIELIVIPRNPTKEVFHQKANNLLSNSLWLPLINGRMILSFFIGLLGSAKLWSVLFEIARKSRSMKILLKNLAVVPKGVLISSFLQRDGVDHIHAHWGSTTATMAYVVSELSGIPWSLTFHRWDIAENNLLETKVKNATFIRCIAEDGKTEVLDLIGSMYLDKIKVIHMGVVMPNQRRNYQQKQKRDFIIACPANFVPKKGHSYLIRACVSLLESNIKDFTCLLIGDGPLDEQLYEDVSELNLQYHIRFLGRIPHEMLMAMYEKGEVDLVVLPSIVTDDGEKEGIPVALMEAMAYGIPVISTETGGTPELLGDGAGVLVQEKNSQQLAEYLEKFITDKKMVEQYRFSGYEKVKREFDISQNTAHLLELITNSIQDMN